MRVRVQPRRRRGVSLTAMTDVVFLLLLFFMVTSTFTRFAHIDLSAGRAGASVQDAAPGILVRIGTDGDWQINGLDILESAIGEELARLEAAGAESAMLLPRTGVSTQQLVTAMDTFRRASALPVTLVR